MLEFRVEGEYEALVKRFQRVGFRGNAGVGVEDVGLRVSGCGYASALFAPPSISGGGV
jgi:hypothetical protein